MAGTSMVKDAWTGPAGSSYDTSLIDVQGTLFFSADDGSHGEELWRSDGTAAGTAMVLDIRPAWIPSAPRDLVSVGG